MSELKAIMAAIPAGAFSVEEEVDMNPVINDRKTIQVVYSIDSAVSILAASFIKKLVARSSSDSIGSLTHVVDFLEVGAWRGNEPRDTVIWLDLNKRPSPGTAMEDTRHFVLRGHGSGEWYESNFAEKISSRAAAIGFEIRTVDDKVTELRGNSKINLGILLNAVAAFSHAAPEFSIPDTDDLIDTLSDLQSELVMFNSKSCKTTQLLTTFADICDALCYLGHQAPSGLKVQPGDKTLTELIREGDFTASFYYQEFLNIRKLISTQATRQFVAIKATNLREVNKEAEVIVTRLPNYFWIARRTVTINGRYFHNSRFTGQGIHITSNLPETATPVTQRLDILNEA